MTKDGFTAQTNLKNDIADQTCALLAPRSDHVVEDILDIICINGAPIYMGSCIVGVVIHGGVSALDPIAVIFLSGRNVQL